MTTAATSATATHPHYTIPPSVYDQISDHAHTLAAIPACDQRGHVLLTIEYGRYPLTYVVNDWQTAFAMLGDINLRTSDRTIRVSFVGTL